MRLRSIIALRRCTGAALMGLALLASSCTAPMGDYRDAARGPDERLLELVECYGVERDARATRMKEGGAPLQTGLIRNELRRLHLEYPTHAATLFTLATLTYEEGGPERAAAYLDDLFAVQPAHPEGGVLRSRIAISEGNLPAARRVLEQQIRYTPDHAGLREALGSTAYMAGELDEARRELEMARRLGAPTWRVAYNLGLIEEASGNQTLAMERYEVAIAENPDFHPATSRLMGLRALFGDVVR